MLLYYSVFRTLLAYFGEMNFFLVQISLIVKLANGLLEEAESWMNGFSSMNEI